MDRAGRPTRPPSRRKPLSDASYRANIGTSSPSEPEKFRGSHSSRVSLPHHESLMPNGPLTVRNITTSAEDKRLSALTNEEQLDSKRNSQISTTSTSASGRKRKTHIGPWQLGVELGKGGCGRVRKVRHAMTGQEAAAKIISKKVAEQARAQSLANLAESSVKPHAESLAVGKVMPFGVEREVVIMKLLEHPNVVRLYDVWENRNELYLIMEYVEGGELFEYVEREGCLAEDETIYLFRQVIAALLHCHRLGIHHRDLKPENILLEKETLQIKLVDFGMAALQPRGKLLTTPCGSIHYAAPDVLERSYDGSKADVWSCGIILYVMLTGNTPFQYDPTKDVSVWYRTLRAGQIPLPNELSLEAKDLIQRILVPDAKRRITLEGVWNHPLLHKYDKDWGLTDENTKLENIMGPKPVIQQWSVREKSDIDREILRNLRTLWHSEKESTLVEKLLNKEGNQEKYFYAALQKHREEQLENYVGFPDTVSCSTSDHHHIAPHGHELIPPVPPVPAVRTKSQFSIMNDEHLHSMSSIQRPPASIGSYDPYRASQDRIISSKDDYMNVTVHRGGSKINRNQGSAASQRPPSSQRVNALKRERQHSSGGLTPKSLNSKSTPRIQSAATKRTASRNSLATSIYSSSPPAGVVRAKAPHKRGVQFGHHRKSSAASGLSTRASSIANMQSIRTPKNSNRELPQLVSSSDRNSCKDAGARSRKENLTVADERQQKGRTDSQVIASEARKVSSELEKFCEQAFFRSSVASSGQTSRSERVSSYDTPPSSVSQGPSPTFPAPSSFDHQQHRSSYSSRPLPDLPPETPNTYIARELAETRKRLVTRYAQEDAAKNQIYQEVLAHLDALLQPSGVTTASSDGRRINSAPEQKAQGNMGVLPIISEEGKGNDLGEDLFETLCPRPEQRAVTDPITQTTMPHVWRSDDPSSTIRLISPTSLPQVAPLNIRKRSEESLPVGLPNNNNVEGNNLGKYSRASSSGNGIQTIKIQSAMELDKISEETIRESSSKVRETPILRKKNWFWRKAKSPEISRSDGGELQASSPVQSNLNSEITEDVYRSRLRPSSTRLWSSLDQMAKAHKDISQKRSIRKFLGRRTASREQEKMIQLTVHDGSSSILDTKSSGRGSSQHHKLDTADAEAATRDLGMQRNWLARFLHIKPVSKLMCLQVGRGRARQDLFRLLRSWKTYGMRDVKLDRLANVIYARLDQHNYLQLKEIAFTTELFVVLQNGRRANLTIVRFTQRNGAASSFGRVIDTIEEVFHRRGALVEDKAMWRDMCETLG